MPAAGVIVLAQPAAGEGVVQQHIAIGTTQQAQPDRRVVQNRATEGFAFQQARVVAARGSMTERRYARSTSVPPSASSRAYHGRAQAMAPAGAETPAASRRGRPPASRARCACGTAGQRGRPARRVPASLASAASPSRRWPLVIEQRQPLEHRDTQHLAIVIDTARIEQAGQCGLRVLVVLTPQARILRGVGDGQQPGLPVAPWHAHPDDATTLHRRSRTQHPVDVGDRRAQVMRAVLARVGTGDLYRCQQPARALGHRPAGIAAVDSARADQNVP